jgi:hypothetical protein
MRGMPRARFLALLLLCLPLTSARAVDEKRVNAAIDRGVTALRRMQSPYGKWAHVRTGATALAALTLLECEVPPADPAIKAAARVLRREAPLMTDTYSVALSILFFDRLGDPKDIPLIESLMVRLLAGQQASGAWSYQCPNLSPKEMTRLQGIVDRSRELTTKPGGARPTAEKKRTVEDLSPEIRRQLESISRMPPRGGAATVGLGGDNSNTQFAVLALWVGRRYGVPIEGALTRINLYFRSQQNADGGWSYSDHAITVREKSTPAMTCAGLLGLAVAHGVGLEWLEEKGKARGGAKPGKDTRIRTPDIKKDLALQSGLLALSTAVGVPTRGRAPVPVVRGHGFYFLWSLERVGVVLDLKTIGGKNWYEWGTEVLLANQMADGTWRAAHADGGADTCFALLFLKRSNLATDLTTRLGKKVGDVSKELRSGGVGGSALKGGAASRLPSGFEPVKGSSTGTRKPPPEGKPGPLPGETEAARLANEVLEAPAGRQGDLLDKLSSTRGVENTQALRAVIARAEAEVSEKARKALAMRFAHLKPTTLTVYLKHEDDEFRQAAALALGMKESREQVPDLIRALSDREPRVVRAARASLKAITRQDFGPEPGASKAEQARAIAQWELWWASHRGS